MPLVPWQRLLILLYVLIAPSLAVAQVSAGTEEAKPTKVSWNYEAGVLSRYIWRGFADYEGVSWQQTVRVGYGGFGASFWNEAGRDDASAWKVRENDVELHYSREVHGTTFTAGYINYWVLLDRSVNHELYLSASRGKRWVTTASVYQLARGGSGTYLSVGVQREFQLTPRWTSQVVTTLGFNRKMYIPKATLSDAALVITFPHRSASFLSLTPLIGFSKSLNRRFFPNAFYSGITFSIGSPD